MTPEQTARIRTAAKGLEDALNECSPDACFTVTHRWQSWRYLASQIEGQIGHRIEVEVNDRRVIA